MMRRPRRASVFSGRYTVMSFSTCTQPTDTRENSIRAMKRSRNSLFFSTMNAAARSMKLGFSGMDDLSRLELGRL